MTLDALLVCLVVGAVLAVSASALVRVLPPALATVLLTSAALTVSAGTGFVAAVLAFEAAARLPAVARIGGWNTHDFGTGQGPVQGVIAGSIVLALLIQAARTFVEQGRQLWRSAAACRAMPHAAGLVITNDIRSPHALAGFPGRVIVGAPVLAALTPAHRRALLAHEEAHLASRHHLYLQLVEIAIAANPALRPVRHAVRLSTERWADEYAARQVKDRRVVAAAITAAATFATPMATTTRLASAKDGVTYRVRALLHPPRHTRLPVLGLGVLLLLPALAAAAAAHATESTFEHAHVRMRTTTTTTTNAVALLLPQQSEDHRARCVASCTRWPMPCTDRASGWTRMATPS